MKATFYKGLSNIEKTRVVSAGQSVAEAFPDIDFDNAVVIVNGRERTADYVLRESDVVTIRELPSGVTAAVTAIVLVALAVTAGVIGGVQIYKAKKAAEDAQKELEKMKKQSNKDDIDNRPFLRGASNTVANGKSQPYVCGRHLFTPYLLCSPFYEISGEDGSEQHTYTVLECGFNSQVLQKIAIDDITIKSFGDTSPQEGSYALDGGQVFAEDGMIEIAQDGKPFGSLTELNYKTISTACNDEIPRDITVENGNADYLTYTLDANALNVTVAITFPYGLYAYNDDADKIKTEVTITPQYSLNGGKTWTPFGFSNGASLTLDGTNVRTLFNKNVSSKELRYVAAKTFTLDDYRALSSAGQKNILLRVRSNGNDDAKIKNDCYVLFYQSRCFDPEKSSYPAGTVHDSSVGLVPCQILEDRERAFCTILGLKVKASANNEDKLKKINVVTQGVARTWNGRQWSAAKSATRNAAAWALEILTSDSHPLSKFSDGEIDMESFGEFYDYCESNKFYFDYVITQDRKKGDTLNMILNNCGASLYWDIYGRLSVAIDRSKDNAIAVYNPQNIISIQNKKTFARRTDGLRVRYVSGADDLYQEDTYLLMRTVNGKALELNADSAIKDVTVTGITTFEHVVKYARRMMALEILRPKTTTIEIGNEGIYFTPYSKVLLQDDSLKIGTGNGTIKALQWTDGKLEKIFLDNPVTFESGKNYGAIVNCFGDNKAVPLSLKVSGSGFTDALTVETPVSDGDGTVPETGCVVSFGELDGGGNFGRITTPYLISNISRNEKGFRLELVNYNEAVYSTGTIPDYKSNITQKPAASQAAIPPDFVTKDEMMEAIVNGIDTSAEPPDTPIVAECVAYRDYISTRMDALPEEKKNEILKVEWQVSKKGFWEDFLANISFSGRYEFAREKDGYPEAEDLNWQIRCRVTNTRGVSSEWSEPRAVDTSAYGTWRVSAAYGASARTYDSESIRLSFSSRRPSERQYYGSTRFNVTVSYDGKPIRTETDVPFGTYYYFDRETDGYPERHENAADGIRDLSLYSFTIRPVEEYTGEIGEEVKVGPDESYYRTWLIPKIRTSATAQEHYVMLQWGLDGEIPYGTLRYDLYLGGEPLAKSLTAGYHAYRFAENLTKEEVAALAFTVVARNEAHEGAEEFAVDASSYLGYKVEKPWIKAAARKEGIDVSWNRTNDFYGKCEYVLLKDGEEILRSERETEYFLRFGEDEFPEREDIERISLQVRIEGDADSATSDPAEIDCSDYLTWIPQVPKAYPSASGRSASLSWDRQDGVYGFAGCEIQIAKGYRATDGKMSPVTDAEELEWYAPALGLNPYESVENYRRGEPGGRLEVNGNSVTFSLPLFGQDEDRACDTPYAFRLRGKTSAGKVSEWTEALFVLCKAVSASDVVRAWDLDDKGERVKVDGALGAAQIFVEELSAITANLGYITDGALRGNAYNYWAVSDTPMDDGSTLWRGSFRVGGSDQYILVEPRLHDGAPTGEYDITFVVGAFSVSATGTQVRGGSFEVYDDDGNLVFSAAQDGTSAVIRRAALTKKGLTEKVIRTENRYYADYNHVFDPFEYKGNTCAVLYSLDALKGAANFNLMLPDGMAPISFDPDVLAEYPNDGFFASTESSLSGGTLRTAYVDFDLEAMTASPSAFARLAKAKNDARESVELGETTRAIRISTFLSGENGTAFAFGKYWHATVGGDSDSDGLYGNCGIYASDEQFYEGRPGRLVLPLDIGDGSYFSAFALGGRLIVWQGVYSYDATYGTFRVSEDGERFAKVVPSDGFTRPERMWLLGGVYFALCRKAKGDDCLYFSYDLASWTRSDRTRVDSMAFDGRSFLATYSSVLYRASADDPATFVQVQSSSYYFKHVYALGGKTLCVGTRGTAVAEPGADLSQESSWTKREFQLTLSDIYEGAEYDGSVFASAYSGSNYYMVRVDLDTMESTAISAGERYYRIERKDDGFFYAQEGWGNTPTGITKALLTYWISAKSLVTYGGLLPLLDGSAPGAYLTFLEDGGAYTTYVLDGNFAVRQRLALYGMPAFDHVGGTLYLLVQTGYILVLARVNLSSFATELLPMALAVNAEDPYSFLVEFMNMSSQTVFQAGGHLVTAALPLAFLDGNGTKTAVVGHVAVSESDPAWTPVPGDGALGELDALADVRIYLTDDQFEESLFSVGLSCGVGGAVIESEITMPSDVSYEMSSILSLRRFDFGKPGETAGQNVVTVRDGIEYLYSDRLNTAMSRMPMYGAQSRFVAYGGKLAAYAVIFDYDYSKIMTGNYYVPSRYSLIVFNEEEEHEQLGTEAHGAGVGFTELREDKVTGAFRLMISDPELFGGRQAYIEFNADGTLSAQTGAQGPQGAAGRDGRDGADGKDGATPEITVSATVDGGSGEPSVEVVRSGTAERPEFALAFSNLRGEKGDPGERGEKGEDGKDGTLSVDGAPEAEIDDAGHALGSNGVTLTRTPWSKVWTWIKGKIEGAVMALKASSLTMTGSVSYQGSKSKDAMIVFMDNTQDTYGNGIAIGGGGMTVVGGGEAASLFRDSSGSERLILANDNAVEFYSNCQNGTGSAKKMNFDASGNLEVPGQVLLMSRSGMWIRGRDNAALRQKTAAALWAPIMSIKSKSGSFEIGGTSENDVLYVRYASDANYNAGTNSVTDAIQVSTASASFGVKIYANAGIRIPTSQPANLENGMIWIT